MNLHYAVRNAEAALADGDLESAESCLRLAEVILSEIGPERDDVAARCCHFTLPDGRIHCGRSDEDSFEEKLFLGMPEKRKALCQACAMRSAVRAARIRALLKRAKLRLRLAHAA